MFEGTRVPRHSKHFSKVFLVRFSRGYEGLLGSVVVEAGLNLVPGSGEGSKGSGGLIPVPVLLVDLLRVEIIKTFIETQESPPECIP